MNVRSLRLVAAVAAVAIFLTSPTRAAVPNGRYTYPTAGTVYDTKTKLTWQQTVPSTTYAWADAKTYCAGAGAALGGAGWRLPTAKELQTIVDDSRTGPSIDPTAFPATPATGFWSSSPMAALPSSAWIVVFAYGESDYDDMPFMHSVRCVR